ncbi:MAG TPA: isoprenylcysteine carboxylmethyltransferase family protein [Vicinamibacterales bacterium]|nr:isoprenylcysteine carboxylmethyltransferase family protein [Vicinamibacterales bacterium]
MTPLPFIWRPDAILFWIVYLWAFVPEFGLTSRARHGGKGAFAQDRGSMAVIMLGMWAGLFVAFPLAFTPRFAMPVGLRAPALWTGTALLVAGSLLRRHCWRMLGPYFTGNVQTVAGQPVIDRGAYRFVRHPSYTAGMIMFAGIGCALGNWLSVLVTFVSSIAVYLYRVHVEERALVAALGAPYLAFVASRKRFIPFVY